MSAFRLAFITVVAATLAAAQPQKISIPAKKAPTHEALWLMKRVGSPVPSPDGKWVVASVTDPSYDEKEQSSDLWLMPVDGSTLPRQITHNKASESDVTWSPDSHTIAFSSKREGDDAAQIYLLDITGGGEAKRLANDPAMCADRRVLRTTDEPLDLRGNGEARGRRGGGGGE